MRSPRRMWRVATTPKPLFGMGVTRHEASSDTSVLTRDVPVVPHPPAPTSTLDTVGSAAVLVAEAIVSFSSSSFSTVPHGGGCALDDADWSAATGPRLFSVAKCHCVR